MACEVREGNPKYLFEAMMPQNHKGDGVESNKTRVADEVLQLMLLQMEEKMFEERRIVASLELVGSNYPEHFQGSTMLFPIVMPPLSMAPPHGHSLGSLPNVDPQAAKGASYLHPPSQKISCQKAKS